MFCDYLKDWIALSHSARFTSSSARIVEFRNTTTDGEIVVSCRRLAAICCYSELKTEFCEFCSIYYGIKTRSLQHFVFLFR